MAKLQKRLRIRKRTSAILNLRVRPEIVEIVERLTETWQEDYYQVELVSMALAHFDATLAKRGIKPGDDIQAKLGL